MGGVGAAAGPLIGGLITTAISWRAAFVFQALIIVVIFFLSRPIVDPVAADPTRRFDVVGTVLSAAGLVLIVFGIMQADTNVWLMLALSPSASCSSPGSSCMSASDERYGKEPLLSTALFKNRTSNLGLVTQNIQWLLLMGTSVRRVRVPASRARLQRHRRPASSSRPRRSGILVSSLAAERLAKKYRSGR